MPNEIIYDRLFIKLKNDTYIPIIQHGSSNCWEYDFFTKREIPEKHWWNINHMYNPNTQKTTYQDFWTKEQLEELADEWKTKELFKSRETPFTEDEFKRWFLNGTKKARTIEELKEYNITLYIWVDTYFLNKNYFHYLDIQNEDELIPKINRIKEWIQEHNLPNGIPVYTIGFRERDCMKRLPRKPYNKKKKPKDLTHYFVIGKRDKTLYIYKKTPIRWLFCWKTEYAKKFETAKEAAKWFAKYQYKLNEPKNWDIFEINNTTEKPPEKKGEHKQP